METEEKTEVKEEKEGELEKETEAAVSETVEETNSTDEVMDIEDDMFSSSSGSSDSSIEEVRELSVSYNNDSDEDSLLAGIGSHVRGGRKVPTSAQTPTKKPISPNKGNDISSSDEEDNDDGFVDPKAEGQGRENIFSKLRGMSPARASPAKGSAIQAAEPSPSPVRATRLARPSAPEEPRSPTPSDIVNRQLAADKLAAGKGLVRGGGVSTPTTSSSSVNKAPVKKSSPLPLVTGSLMRRASHKPSEEATAGKEHDAEVSSLKKETMSSEAATVAAAQRATDTATGRTKTPPPIDTPPAAPFSPGRVGRGSVAVGRVDTAQCNFCLRRMPKADMDGHLSTCALRIEVCPGGCGQRIRFVKMDKHLRDECTHRKDAPVPPPPAPPA
jgi:hypothetical protein